ncbi:major facilitator superfamily domain-containing protein [Xylariaceae sp. FL0804]|nr:major facilitator superfamily domain-containing protein [Xylariaceae sp. FL0804]
MESTLFKTLVEVESNGVLPQAPERVKPRTYPAVPQQQEAIELDAVRRPRYEAIQSGATTPREERDLEMSAPGTPAEPADVFEALPTLTNPPMNKYRLATCCLQNFVGGLTDSAPGALIPYMEKYYGIGYAVVSLIFIGNALGFILAAPLVDRVRARLGRARALGLAELCKLAGFLPLLCAAPFPAVVVGYFAIGFGFAISLAIGNVFCANLARGTTMLGAMHGSYGVGGTLGPLIATSIVARDAGTAAGWSRYYFLTVGFAAFNAAFATWSFWRYEADSRGAAEAAALTHTTSHGAPPATTTTTTTTTHHPSALLATLKSRVVLLGAIFIFAYQGAEVSISGWAISFLIAVRNGDPTRVGYVTAGFWAGITLGRFALSPLGARFGEKRFVYGLAAGAAACQLLVWLVPNVVGDAVSLSVVGLLLGPVYPCAAAVFARNLSRAEQVSGLGVISAFGSSGGAVVPLLVGVLAQAASTFVLHPIAIGLFGVMVACWYGQPAKPKRDE